MKVDAFYDVFCDFCGRSVSRDFACGLCDSAIIAVKEARRMGFRVIGGKRICPACMQRLRVRDVATDRNSVSQTPGCCK